MNDIRKARYKYGKLPIIFIKEAEVFTDCIPFGDFNVDGYMVSNYGRVYNNMIHAVNHGLVKIGENDHKSIHSNELVHSICKVLETNYCTNREVCQILNIPFSLALSVVSSLIHL